MSPLKRVILAAFLACATFSLAVPAGAAPKYPTKPITVIIPFGGSGAANVIYRKLFDVMKEKKYLPQPLVVENKPGSGGAVGWTLVQAMKPDGYHLSYGSNSLIIQTHRTKGRLNYKNFEPIVRLNETPVSIDVNATSGWNTLADFIKYAKAHPGKVRVGNAGAGAFYDLATYRFEKITGTKLVHVPYKGGPIAGTALLGAHIEAAMLTTADLVNVLSTGKIKVLANASDKRDPLFPDIPTMKEKGVNLSAVLWRGVVSPKGISKDKIAILEAAFRKATSDPEYVEFMKTRKFANTFVPHAEFAKAYFEEGKTMTALLGALDKGKK